MPTKLRKKEEEEEDKEEAELRKDLIQSDIVKPRKSFFRWCKTFLFGVLIGIGISVLIWYLYIRDRPRSDPRQQASQNIGSLLKQVEDLGQEREHYFAWTKPH